MTIITQRTAPTVQIVIHQIVIRLQLLPTLLTQIQLLTIVKITTNRENLILKFYSFVSKITTFVHLVEVYQLMALYVELKHLLIEPFTPSPAQNVNELTLRHCSSIRKRKEKLCRQNSPFISLRRIDFNCA